VSHASGSTVSINGVDMMEPVGLAIGHINVFTYLYSLFYTFEKFATD